MSSLLRGLLLLFALLGACEPEAPVEAPMPPTGRPVAWPDPAHALVRLPLDFPPPPWKPRIYLDPGHGTSGTPGTTSAYCALEDDFNLDVARDLARALEGTGRFTVRLARTDDQGPRYAERIRAAAAWDADALLSIHADARGVITLWEPQPGLSCPVSRSGPGFAVLIADGGPDALTEGRRTLGRGLARRMQEAGFPAFDGLEYGDVYEPDPVAPGLFYDRHLPGQRLAMARGPAMPSALVETHHALHPQENARWQDPATRDAFARAVMVALADLLGGRPACLDDLQGSH